MSLDNTLIPMLMEEIWSWYKLLDSPENSFSSWMSFQCSTITTFRCSMWERHLAQPPSGCNLGELCCVLNRCCGHIFCLQCKWSSGGQCARRGSLVGESLNWTLFAEYLLMYACFGLEPSRLCPSTVLQTPWERRIEECINAYALFWYWQNSCGSTHAQTALWPTLCAS